MTPGNLLPQTESVSRERIALACRVLAHRGLADGILGHISLKITDSTLLVRCRGPYERGLAYTQAEDIRMVDLDGNPATPAITLHRQLAGPGGHAGKRSGSFVHFGLGAGAAAANIVITWPDAARTETQLPLLSAGTYEIDFATGATPVRIP